MFTWTGDTLSWAYQRPRGPATPWAELIKGDVVQRSLELNLPKVECLLAQLTKAGCIDVPLSRNNQRLSWPDSWFTTIPLCQFTVASVKQPVSKKRHGLFQFVRNTFVFSFQRISDFVKQTSKCTIAEGKSKSVRWIWKLYIQLKWKLKAEPNISKLRHFIRKLAFCLYKTRCVD